MMPSTISTAQPISAHTVDHQNVRISQVMCDSTHVPRASLRFTYATMTPMMPMNVSSGAGTAMPRPADLGQRSEPEQQIGDQRRHRRRLRAWSDDG